MTDLYTTEKMKMKKEKKYRKQRSVSGILSGNINLKCETARKTVKRSNSALTRVSQPLEWSGALIEQRGSKKGLMQMAAFSFN